MAAWFVLDLSKSVDFGSDLKDWQKISIGFVGVLARLLTQRGNRVGALVFGNIETVIPPRGGRLRNAACCDRWSAARSTEEDEHRQGA
jgi:uncharacterized protein (DUF58 family)